MTISDGVVHKVPEDLRKTLMPDTKALTLWESLTPLARNEWICWVTFVKKEETRKSILKDLLMNLREGSADRAAG